MTLIRHLPLAQNQETFPLVQPATLAWHPFAFIHQHLRIALEAVALGSALLCFSHQSLADDMSLSAGEDNIVVHHLAHMGAGANVGAIQDFFLSRFKAGTWARAWQNRMLLDALTSGLITDIYESNTNKDLSTRLQHDGDGILGALLIVGASVQWSF
jgi:hypothetical protein